MEQSAILQRFMQKFPIPVMIRILLERLLTADRLNACFAKASNKQYTRELLFSSVFELMSLVVFKAFPSLNAAYQAGREQIGVSLVSVYNKLNGLDIAVAALLVRETAQDMASIISQVKGECAPLLPGYRVKMVDGNCLAATHRRLKVLRNQRGGPLPGKTMVVYDPALEMVVDVIPCEDGHTQERTLLAPLRQIVQRRDVLIMDSLFCVCKNLSDLSEQDAYFICRNHKRMPYEALSELKSAGISDTGTLQEQ
ncbi:MAG: IS4/IS5 family transposase, partial [Janthinobacterium lividum]|nr:IS4/IS5 family transposase [Janthinobacterium lividum]